MFGFEVLHFSHGGFCVVFVSLDGFVPPWSVVPAEGAPSDGI